MFGYDWFRMILVGSLITSVKFIRLEIWVYSFLITIDELVPPNPKALRRAWDAMCHGVVSRAMRRVEQASSGSVRLGFGATKRLRI